MWLSGAGRRPGQARGNHRVPLLPIRVPPPLGVDQPARPPFGCLRLFREVVRPMGWWLSLAAMGLEKLKEPLDQGFEDTGAAEGILGEPGREAPEPVVDGPHDGPVA